MRPKDIGTAAETAVVRALRRNGFPHAERRALHGNQDLGDITGTPGLVWEVKGGEAAKAASDGQVQLWLDETETERNNAGACYGILVLQRRGIGPANADRWWAIRRVKIGDWLDPVEVVTVRMTLADMCVFLRSLAFGQPLPEVAS